MARNFKLTADGGSRGNPGPAGYGAVVTENGKIVAELFDVIGIATNNVAEYSGLLAGLPEDELVRCEECRCILVRGL